MVRWNCIILALIFFLFGNYRFRDVEEAFVFYGSKLFPTSPGIGIILVIFFIFFIFFTDDLISLFKNKKIRIKNKFGR